MNEMGQSFSSIGQAIMRRTDDNQMHDLISNKKLFSRSGGIGPATVGSDDWLRAKEK